MCTNATKHATQHINIIKYYLLDPQSSKPLLVELLLALLLVRDVVPVLAVLALLPKPGACLGGGEIIPFGGASRPPVVFTPVLAAVGWKEGPKPSSPSSWLFFLVFYTENKYEYNKER